MYQSDLSASDEQATNSQGFNGRILTLLTSEELEQGPCLPGLENIPVSYTHLALLRPDQVLMELKAPGAIPLWMVRLLTEMEMCIRDRLSGGPGGAGQALRHPYPDAHRPLRIGRPHRGAQCRG